MGKFLFIGAVMLLIAGILNIFLRSSALFITIAVLMIGVFSAFIVYDLKRVKDGQETNYISATLNIYLDLYNIFQALLSILGIAGGESARLTRFAELETGPVGRFRWRAAPTVSAATPGHAAVPDSRSKTAMLSTCAVCGNMLTAPAAAQR